jgi:FkbM family methyltransferase
MNFSFRPFNIFSRVRFVQTKQLIFAKKISVPDKLSFIWQYKDIFLDELYWFDGIENSKVIIDIGSNIGLSLIYFKKFSRESTQVIGVEADKKIFNIAQENLSLFKFENVILYNKAAWVEDTVLVFNSDGADGGSVGDKATKSNGNDNLVSAIDINTLLNRFEIIDFVKMDIEGAEEKVFPHVEKNLSKIKNIFIEYHGTSEHNFLS